MLLRRLPQRLPVCESLLSVLRFILSLRLRVCKRFADAIDSLLSDLTPVFSVGRMLLDAKCATGVVLLGVTVEVVAALLFIVEISFEGIGRLAVLIDLTSESLFD